MIVNLVLNFILILICVIEWYILILSFGVFISDVVIIIDNESIMFWFILVIIVLVVSGNCILNSFCDVVDLNVFVVLIKFFGICLIFKLVKWIVGGIVKIIDVIILGIILILKNVIVGMRYMNVGIVCIKFNVGFKNFEKCLFWDVNILIGILIIIEIIIDVSMSVNVCIVCV